MIRNVKWLKFFFTAWAALLIGCVSNMKSSAWVQSFDSGVTADRAIASCEYDLEILGKGGNRTAAALVGIQDPTFEACMKRYGWVWRKISESNSPPERNLIDVTGQSCQVNSDCGSGFSCRSKGGGGLECRRSAN